MGAVVAAQGAPCGRRSCSCCWASCWEACWPSCSWDGACSGVPGRDSTGYRHVFESGTPRNVLKSARTCGKGTCFASERAQKAWEGPKRQYTRHRSHRDRGAAPSPLPHRCAVEYRLRAGRSRERPFGSIFAAPWGLQRVMAPELKLQGFLQGREPRPLGPRPQASLRPRR